MLPPILTLEDIRAAISPGEAIEAARTAFRALHEGTVASPAPWHLEIADGPGEVHVKGASIDGEPYAAVKLATGFPGNPVQGLPSSDGMSVILESSTGRIAAIVLDGGYLTDLRTGAAGALALDLLGPADVRELAIIGTGAQARFQLRAALGVRSPEVVSIYGRDEDRALEFATWARSICPAAVQAHVIDRRPLTADAIVTVTLASSPILFLDQIAPGAHITAVGSDSPGKRELEPALVRGAGVVAVDVLAQSQALGELQGIPTHDVHAVTIGSLLTGTPSQRERGAITIADLTGTGAQDAAIASLVASRLLRS